MRRRPEGLVYAAGVGGAGAIWGLGLARLVAEVGFCSRLYASPLVVAGVAALCAAVALAAWWWGLVPAPGSGSWGAGLSLVFLTLPLLYVVGVTPCPLAGGVLLAGGAAFALLSGWASRLRWLPPAVLGLATFGLYLRTMLPSVGQADTFEFQVIVPLLRVAHPTGYPLYVLLAKLFTLLPLGNVAWRVNLASAFFATGAVLVLYVVLLRLNSLLQAGGDAHGLSAFLAALAFAFSSTFWSQAVVAEVYALHNLLVALLLWLLVGCGAPSERAPLRRRWQLVFFLFGLSLTNHLTTALLLPAIALALLWDRPRLPARDWLLGGGLLLVGLSVYLFIPLRWPALNRGEWMTLRAFVSYITGGQFHGALRLDGWRDPVRWDILWRLLREPFGWAGLGLALIGVVGMAVRRRRALLLTGVTFLAFAFYGLDYYVPDISVFLLPIHLILAIWMGAGASFLINIPLRSISKSHHRLSVISPMLYWSFVGLLALLPLSRIWLNFSAVDRSHDRGGYAWGEYVLSLPLAPDSAVLADVEKFAPLYYLQQIEGVRPDLDLLLLGSEELYQAELRARLGGGQTVYLARYLPNLEGMYLRSLGPLVEVSPRVFSEGRVPDRVGVRFGEEIRLLDAELSPDPLERPLHHLTLYWRADMPVRDDVLIRLRLVDAEGRVGWESDGARPVAGMYPANAWLVDAVVRDYHEVPLSPWLPRGEYELEVGVFPPFDDVGLRVGGHRGTWLALGTLEVPATFDHRPPLPYERRYCFAGGGWLTGYNVAGEVPAGAPLVVDLSWSQMATEADVRLAWVDDQGRDVGAAVFPLAAGAVRSRHVITAPQMFAEHQGRSGRWSCVRANVRLRVGLVDAPARCAWLARPSAGCTLTPVQVTLAHEGLANFAERILLLEADVGQGAVRAGEIVPVALRWRALRAMGENYTVFVHLVGPDGRLHGQVDMWPVQGSHPTGQWTPGAEFADPYEVRLAPDAPPGRYRVEVGWYLLSTMQRLQVLSADGRPVDDSFVVGEFDVVD